MTHHPVILLLTSALHFTAFILVTLHCLQRRRNASATILWIFVAWSFPIIGPLIYLGFGVDRVNDRANLKFLADRRVLKARNTISDVVSCAYWNDLADAHAPAANELEQSINSIFDALLPDHPALAGNRIDPLLTGDEAYPEMLAAIRGATDHIHLQSFIIGNDAVSREFIDALAAKAAEGVQVRLLYDRFGSTSALFGGLFRRARKTPGFKVAGWTQANPFKRQFQINLRNHRKVLVVDGTVGFFGGINISAKNRTAPDVEPIRDYHFRVEGPLVQELQFAFMRDWYFITREPPDKLLARNFFPPVVKAGDIAARLVNSGPASIESLAAETFFNCTVLAKKQILAVTPYFVPNADLLRALRSAALRGVDVRLIVPKDNNHRYVKYASRALYDELLSAGVRIFERHPPFMHAKAFIIDGHCSIVGTANLDVRSLHLNYETCAAVYSTAFADRMKLIIHEDLDCSDEILQPDWQKRPRATRLLENFASLLTPVL
jgi:cardiolipin synthase